MKLIETMSSGGAGKRTLEVDDLFVRNIHFKDVGGYPVPPNQLLFSRGDGGTFFADLPLPCLSSILRSFNEARFGSNITLGTSNWFNRLWLEPGSGIDFFKTTDDGQDKIHIYTVAPQKLEVVGGSTMNFTTALADNDGRTLKYAPVGDISISISSDTVFFQTQFNNNFSALSSTISTVTEVQKQQDEMLYQINTSIGAIDQLTLIAGVTNIQSSLSSVQGAYVDFLTNVNTFLQFDTDYSFILQISSIKTQKITTDDFAIQSLAVGSNILYDQCLLPTNSGPIDNDIIVANGVVSTFTNYFFTEDGYSEQRHALEKEYLESVSTAGTSTFITRGANIATGWVPNISTLGDPFALSIRNQFYPILQQTQILEYVSTPSHETTLNYVLRNTGRFDRICASDDLYIDATNVHTDTVTSRILNATFAEVDVLLVSSTNIKDISALLAFVSSFSFNYMEGGHGKINNISSVNLYTSTGAAYTFVTENQTVSSLTTTYASINTLHADSTAFESSYIHALTTDNATIDSLHGSYASINAIDTELLVGTHGEFDTLRANNAILQSTTISSLVVGSQYVNLFTGNMANIGTLFVNTESVSSLQASTIVGGRAVVDQGNFTTLTATNGTIGTLFANTESVSSLQASTIVAGRAIVDQGTFNTLTATNGTIGTLFATMESVSSLQASTIVGNQGNFNTLTATNGTIGTLFANTESVSSLQASTIVAGRAIVDQGTFNTLTATNGTIGTLFATTESVSSLQASTIVGNQGSFTTLTATNGTIGTLFATTESVSSLQASTIVGNQGSFTTLTATNGAIGTLFATTESVSSLQASTIVGGQGTFNTLTAIGTLFATTESVSSLQASTIVGGRLFTGSATVSTATISSLFVQQEFISSLYAINASISTLTVSTLVGFEPLPRGSRPGDYVVWNGTKYAVASTNIILGSDAGLLRQQPYSVSIGYQAGYIDQGKITSTCTGSTITDSAIAIGYTAGFSSQSAGAIAIGNESGQSTQGSYAIAIGDNAGKTMQKIGAIAMGVSAGLMHQQENSIALGNRAGAVYQGDESVAIGTMSGMIEQSTYAVAIGSCAGINDQGGYTIAVGKSAGYSTQGNFAIAIGAGAGYSNQGTESIAIGDTAGAMRQGRESVAIGVFAGTDTQGIESVAVGLSAGKYGQSAFSVAIGAEAAEFQQGSGAVAVGKSAGSTGQGNYAIAVGQGSAYTAQGLDAIAIGEVAGFSTQGQKSIAIGMEAGFTNQGSNAIAIGAMAGFSNQASRSIVINASGSALNTTTEGLFINPVRIDYTVSTGVLMYNSTTKEIVYTTNTRGFIGPQGLQGDPGPKSFVIDHPTNPNKYLVHACLEGPEAGVYYRGSSSVDPNRLYTTIRLPEYTDALATEYTVHLTPVYNGGTPAILSATRVVNGQFTVHATSNCEFDWIVYGKRLSITVEPDKSTAHVNGSGPYRWISS